MLNGTKKSAGISLFKFIHTYFRSFYQVFKFAVVSLPANTFFIRRCHFKSYCDVSKAHTIACWTKVLNHFMSLTSGSVFMLWDNKVTHQSRSMLTMWIKRLMSSSSRKLSSWRDLIHKHFPGKGKRTNENFSLKFCILKSTYETRACCFSLSHH